MNILVDENIPMVTVRALRNQGHDVSDIRCSPEQGMSDEELWTLAQREKRLFITTDKGFSSFRYQEHAGIVIVRLRQPNRPRIHERIMHAFQRIPEQEWPNTMVIIRDTVISTWKGDIDRETIG